MWMYSLLLAYEANVTISEKDKKALLAKVFAKVKVIDFLLNLSYDKMLINSKKYTKLGEKMDDIIKYTTGWVKSINK